MNFFKRLKVLFVAWQNRNTIKNDHGKMRDVSITKWLALVGVTPRRGEYPLGSGYSEKLKTILTGIENIKLFPGKVMDTFLVGDSLSDFPRKDLTSVDTRLNFAKAGEGSNYYLKILKDTKKALEGFDIKYLIIECWGNELLAYFDIEDVKLHVKNTLDLARALYPNAKLIVGALPPVYDVYVNIVKVEFTQFLIETVNQDSNVTLVLLEKKFSGAFGVFPKTEYSSDGVHFSGKGILLYDELLKKAKSSPLKVII